MEKKPNNEISTEELEEQRERERAELLDFLML